MNYHFDADDFWRIPPEQQQNAYALFFGKSRCFPWWKRLWLRLRGIRVRNLKMQPVRPADTRGVPRRIK